MRNYYRVMLGRKSAHAAGCCFIGVDFDIHRDLSNKLPEEWREFKRQFIPVYLSIHPNKTKIGAGLSCGALWTVSKGIKKAVLSCSQAAQVHIGSVRS